MVFGFFEASTCRGGGASGNNMVLVSLNPFDGDMAPLADAKPVECDKLVSLNPFDGDMASGDGNPTHVRRHVDAGTTRVTGLTYDFRNG